MSKIVEKVIHSKEVLLATFNPFDYVNTKNDAREVARRIIVNTMNDDKLDFWSNAQISLLEALLLYVKYEYQKDANMNKVMQLLDEYVDKPGDMDALFEGISPEQPASLAYTIVKQSSELIKTNSIVALKSTLSNIYSNPVLLEGYRTENVLVVGQAGSGKTTRYLVPNVLAENEKSLIIIDPAMESYQYTHKEKTKQGYKVEYITLDELEDLGENELEKIMDKFLEEKTVLYFNLKRTNSTGYNEEMSGELFEKLFNSIKKKGSGSNVVHVFLDEASTYKVPSLGSILATGKTYNTGVSIIVQTVDCINRIYGELETGKINANITKKLSFTN
ncbi:type IV secretory system conjugative DNA transfer family protein [Priestia megaterium]|uniref:type IV secretory system conjugative DNA transfer family protein n=1 Tax=Priestia megaterium TaxID=1404 RepID=UPI0039E1A018